MTTIEVLIDHLGGPRLVGRAHFTRNRGQISTTFVYDPAYLADGGTNIDPALLLVSGAQHQTGLLRAFADSAPDRWGRNLIEKAERISAREERRATTPSRQRRPHGRRRPLRRGEAATQHRDDRPGRRTTQGLRTPGRRRTGDREVPALQ